MRADVSPLDQTILSARKHILRHGWYGVYFPEDRNDGCWEHSIGFQDKLASPEIIVFGLDYAVSHQLIANTFRAIEKGTRLSDHRVLGGIIQRYDCQFRAVHPSHYDPYLLAAKAYHDRHGGSSMFEVFQLIWPDQDGYFPWEEECNPDIAALQPLLYRA